MKEINKDLVHAILVSFCSADVTRPKICKPFSKDGSAYSTDGRTAVRFLGVEGVAFDAGDDLKDTPERIDEYLNVTRQSKPLPEITAYGLELAACMSMADVFQQADKAPDDDGYTCYDDDVESFALVRIGTKCFRAVYLSKVASALRLMGDSHPIFYLKQNTLLVCGGRIAFAVMAVRDIAHDNPDYAIVDAATGTFVHHLSSWMA